MPHSFEPDSSNIDKKLFLPIDKLTGYPIDTSTG